MTVNNEGCGCYLCCMAREPVPACPNVNVPLLRKAVEWVEAEASRPDGMGAWNQSAWVQTETGCGTAYCIAGYVGQVLDERFISSEVATIGDDEIHVSEFAREALGITRRAASRLFYAGNNAGNVRRIAEQIAGGPL